MIPIYIINMSIEDARGCQLLGGKKKSPMCICVVKGSSWGEESIVFPSLEYFLLPNSTRVLSSPEALFGALYIGVLSNLPYHKRVSERERGEDKGLHKGPLQLRLEPTSSLILHLLQGSFHHRPWEQWEGASLTRWRPLTLFSTAGRRD